MDGSHLEAIKTLEVKGPASQSERAQVQTNVSH
jgi:hypothetical protein